MQLQTQAAIDFTKLRLPTIEEIDKSIADASLSSVIEGSAYFERFQSKHDLDHENKKFKQGVNRVGKCTRICRGVEACKV